MEPDLPLMEMAEEDDSLIPDPNPTPSSSSSTYFTCSPFALPPSHTKILKDSVSMEKPSNLSSEASSNKVNIDSNNVEMRKFGMEPMQTKRRKKAGGCNLRKSLAWDRAFFTEEGILDPLELTLITGIDANTCGGGLPTINEEGDHSFSSDVRCTHESNDMEASEEAQLKEVTQKVHSSNHTKKARSKFGVFSEPIAASSLKRPANSNTLKTAKKESKIPKLPISKPGSCLSSTTNGSTSTPASQSRHSLIPKPVVNVQKNVGLKSSQQNVHGSQTKAKTASGSLHKEVAQRTLKNLTNSSKTASSTKSKLVHVDRANIGSELVPDRLQSCGVQQESTPLAAKVLAQHTVANLKNSLPKSDRSHSCVSQEHHAAVVRPSGLRLPSPSLRFFDQSTASESGSSQWRNNQQYNISVGSDRKIREPRPLARTPMKNNGMIENVYSMVHTSTQLYFTPTTRCTPSGSIQLCPSPNYMVKTAKEVPDSNLYQLQETKTVRVPFVPETEDKLVLHKEEDRLQNDNYAGIFISTSGESIQHQEQNISTGVVGSTDLIHDLAQTTREQADTEKSDALKVNPDSKDWVRTAFEEPWEDGIRKREDDVAPSSENYSVEKRRQEIIVSTVVDDKISLTLEEHAMRCSNNSPCSGRTNRTISITSRDSLEYQTGNGGNTDATEWKGIGSMMDTTCNPFQSMNTEVRNDDAELVDIFPTTRSPVRDMGTLIQHDHPSAEVMHVEPSTSIEYKDEIQDKEVNPLNDNPSSEGPCPNVTSDNYNDHLSKEIIGSNCSVAILMELPDQKHAGVDVALIPGQPLTELQLEFREVAPLIDNHNQGLSHLRAKDELINGTASVGGDNALLKTEPVDLEIVAAAVEAEFKIYECDPKPSSTIINHTPSVEQEVGFHSSSDAQLCVEYGTSGSTVLDSIAEHKENYTDGKSTYNTQPESPVDDKMFCVNSTCIGEEVDVEVVQEGKTPVAGEFQHELDGERDPDENKDATVAIKKSNSINRQDNSLVIHPPNAVPFSDEWLAAIEAAGEEILTMKCGAVQHSPPDKSLPEPSPWSPVRRKANQIGPYDCTKYTNAMPSESQ